MTPGELYIDFLRLEIGYEPEPELYDSDRGPISIIFNFDAKSPIYAEDRDLLLNAIFSFNMGLNGPQYDDQTASIDAGFEVKKRILLNENT